MYIPRRVWEGMKNEADKGCHCILEMIVKSCEKVDGCFVLNNALVFKQRNELLGDRK